MLLIDKPLQWTSFDVVNCVRSCFLPQKLKVGHAGTLDPLATGLIIVCTGAMTKNINQFTDMKKEYSGSFCLGATTPSYDKETGTENNKGFKHISHIDVKKYLPLFIGEIYQKPPIFSALKNKGKKLYDYARNGEKVEIKARKVFIDSFEIEDINLPLVHFRVVCSKGTYIRSLAHDFGQKLGTGAYLNSLRREKIGDYSVTNSTPATYYKDLKKQFIKS